MTESPESAGSREADRRLARRYAADRRFRIYGAVAVGLALSALALLLVEIAIDGVAAFRSWEVVLDLRYDPEALGLSEDWSQEDLARANFARVVRNGLLREFPEVQSRRERRALGKLVSAASAYAVQERVASQPALVGSEERIGVLLSGDAVTLVKGELDRRAPESERRLDDAQVAWVDALVERGRVESRFNTGFFTGGDSREPELAGIWGATKGSLFTLFVTLLLSFPIGVGAAVYLEEFAPRNRITDFVEVNINNLAAVPSIVFGLLGLALFLNFWGLPRSSPLVGGLVLSLMTLPTVIIASRSALQAVPPSLREAARGIGASPLQTVMHHVVPLALPGILTGTIIGMARALGETAPLLMIGMVAFIVDVPEGPGSPATVLPVQIFLWADSPERGFVEKTSGAILVLLFLLVLMNLAAVLLRNRFERRW